MDVTATFTIEVQPADSLLPGTGRFTFTKVWQGGMAGTSEGVMLSAGDPGQGEAGYVALEAFGGTIDGRAGTIALSQHGLMSGGDQQLRYAVVPGSGTGALRGLAGEIDLDTSDGAHRVTLRLQDPA